MWHTLRHEDVPNNGQASKDEGQCLSDPAAKVANHKEGDELCWDIDCPKDDLDQVYADPKVLQVHGQPIIGKAGGEPAVGSKHQTREGCVWKYDYMKLPSTMGLSLKIGLSVRPLGDATLLAVPHQSDSQTERVCGGEEGLLFHP